MFFKKRKIKKLQKCFEELNKVDDELKKTIELIKKLEIKEDDKDMVKEMIAMLGNSNDINEKCKTEITIILNNPYLDQIPGSRINQLITETYDYIVSSLKLINSALKCFH